VCVCTVPSSLSVYCAPYLSMYLPFHPLFFFTMRMCTPCRIATLIVCHVSPPPPPPLLRHPRRCSQPPQDLLHATFCAAEHHPFAAPCQERRKRRRRNYTYIHAFKIPSLPINQRLFYLSFCLLVCTCPCLPVSMSAPTCSNVSSASAAGAKGTPLWRRLSALQPTLCLTSSKTLTPAALPPFMSYSFVVVPPPVPAATPNFEAHVAALLSHVPHPVFFTCTSYSAYFSSPAAEAGDAAEEGTSATQRALAYLNRTLPPDAGLVLTITGTRTTTASGGGGGSSTTTLVGASQDGVRAVLRDFVQHTRLADGATRHDHTATAAESAAGEHRSGGLMLLRGDDNGFTRRCLSAKSGTSSMSSSAVAAAEAVVESKTASLVNPYVAFADGAALLRFVRGEQHTTDAVRDLCLVTGAYPQGHVMDRHWRSPPTTPRKEREGNAVGGDSDGDHHHSADELPCEWRQPNPSSLRFLEEVEKVYADTEAQLRHAQGTRRSPRPASVATCTEIVDAILARLHAVRWLWETPSIYSAEARAACTRWLVSKKVMGGGARVMVTQALTSVEEFVQLVDDVQRALCDVLDSSSNAQEGGGSPSQDTSLVLVPGLMAPLRGEQLVRAALQLKVIPSAPLQKALHDYEAALTVARAQLQTCVSPYSSPSSSSPVMREVDDSSSAVKAFEVAKEAAEEGFQRSMEDLTVVLARELHALGYRHLNFSAFQYGCGAAVGRVAARLPH
jgi:hypothetical protein